VTDTRELFVRLTCELEDLHGLAIEGQSASNDASHQFVLAAEICNGLQRGIEIAVRIAEAARPS
jgi:hypothetical protein